MQRRHFLGTTLSTLTLPARAATATPLETFVATRLHGTDFGGTILVARGANVLLRRGYGLANRAFDVAATTDTVYRIASITKLFTATRIAQLNEAGRIDLDAPIAKYLSSYKGPAATKVSVRQLLQHTSGIENFDKGLTSYAGAARTGIVSYQLPHTPRELMDRFASGALEHEPGTTFDYNNADYIILGQIIEAVEGVSYAQALERALVAPLGLKHTGVAAQARIVPRLSPTYYKDGDAPLGNDMPVYPENWYAAGAMYSTVDDLHAFATALYGGRLVRAATLQTMLTVALEEYGFGQWVATLTVEDRKHRFAQRPGRIMGANTLLLSLLDDDVTIVILANTNLVDTDELGFAIAKNVLSAASRGE